jgi:hypothetical protein
LWSREARSELRAHAWDRLPALGLGPWRSISAFVFHNVNGPNIHFYASRWEANCKREVMWTFTGSRFGAVESDAFGGKDARDTGEIICDAGVGPAGLRREDCADAVRRAAAEFDDEIPARAKQRG